jgi:hypothetical protein
MDLLEVPVVVVLDTTPVHGTEGLEFPVKGMLAARELLVLAVEEAAVEPEPKG